MLELKTYNRNPFDVQEVQVTEENIKEVALWVGGEIRTDDVGQYVKVRVHRPINDRQTKAYVGDHVLYAGTGFKVYNDKAFKSSFTLVSDETIMIDPATEQKKISNKSTKTEIVGEIQGDVVVPKRVAKKPAKATKNA